MIKENKPFDLKHSKSGMNPQRPFAGSENSATPEKFADLAALSSICEILKYTCSYGHDYLDNSTTSGQ